MLSLSTEYYPCFPQRTKKPRWGGTWEAKWYRHACPQPVEEIRKDIPDFPRANISEDCLYMNIYAPNVSVQEGKEGCTGEGGLLTLKVLNF